MILRVRTAVPVMLLTLALASAAAAGPRYVLLTILHTNDMHGRVMPRSEPGGLARAATLVRQIRGEMPNVLLLDAGDIIHGTPEEYFSGGRAIIGAMNAVEYDLATAGNHEFDFTLDTLRGVIETARFPFVAANVRADVGGQWDRLEPYRILTIDGIRVGVLGLATLDTIAFQWPARIREIVIEDPFATAKALVPRLRAECDVLVVLSHLGAVPDMQLARDVPGIDFIIGGHSHTPIADWRWVGDTMVAQAGAYARALGRIDLIVRKDEQDAQIVSVNGKGGTTWNDLARRPLDKEYPRLPLIPVEDALAEDEAVRGAYLPYRAEVDARFAEVIGRAEASLPGDGIDSPAANLVADAVRAFGETDIGVIDANSVSKAGLAAGDVTVGAAFDLIGGYTRQHLVAGSISGADLLRALDARFARKKSVTWAVSGASFEYAMANGVPRVRSLRVAGEPVDPARTYTVAAQAYVMMDIMEGAPSVVITAEPSESTREAIIEYIRAARTVAVPASGRITEKR